jgi:phage-related holin
MKSIILKLFYQSWEFISFSICCGFVASFFLPIQHFLSFTIFVVFADTITGIIAAKKRKEEITSKGLYRTSQKILTYFCGIMIFHGASITFGLPSQIVYSVSFLIAFTELYSISENIKSITGVNLKTTILRFFNK